MEIFLPGLNRPGLNKYVHGERMLLMDIFFSPQCMHSSLSLNITDNGSGGTGILEQPRPGFGYGLRSDGAALYVMAALAALPCG